MKRGMAPVLPVEKNTWKNSSFEEILVFNN